jgi:hypothetical protein
MAEALLCTAAEAQGWLVPQQGITVTGKRGMQGLFVLAGLAAAACWDVQIKMCWHKAHAWPPGS